MPMVLCRNLPITGNCTQARGEKAKIAAAREMVPRRGGRRVGPELASEAT